ncbi:SRPBCC family protein [Actinomadura decatromicini]|uniref:SRPBCC family protein n=1 Tax=Actinomadura decatromicini TaxID=2604572 RepID=A0A5D3F3J3_9ACTN|nr:SRPBCC family protein [Actinomadura decatromicini]TYK42723.1 SRPBCC family protein [Actinomadura decatromicini]
MLQATATTTATPEDLFRHLVVPEAWGAWCRLPIPAQQTRKGDTSAYGVGAVRKLWPAVEQTVVYEPYGHYAYIALSGLPVRRYRCDVYLEARDTGTHLRWKAEFEPLVPGTGPLLRVWFRLVVSSLTRWLPAHTEHCPPDCPARGAGDI